MDFSSESRLVGSETFEQAGKANEQDRQIIAWRSNAFRPVLLSATCSKKYYRSMSARRKNIKLSFLLLVIFTHQRSPSPAPTAALSSPSAPLAAAPASTLTHLFQNINITTSARRKNIKLSFLLPVIPNLPSPPSPCAHSGVVLPFGALCPPPVLPASTLTHLFQNINIRR